MRNERRFPLPSSLLLGIIFGWCLVFTAGCYQKAAPPKVREAVPVRTDKVVKEDIQLFYYFTGKTHVEPINIVPRIRGYLEEIHFQSGFIVEKDDVLFKIEQFDYINDVAMAKAKLEVAIADAARCKADYDRETELGKQGQGFTTQASIDRTKALWEEAKGKIGIAKADLAEAEKQLERTVIKAPYKGKISRNLIEKGNLVDGTSGSPPVLATLMAMDPMYVYFQITDAEFNSLMRSIRTAIGEAALKAPENKNLALMEIAKKMNLDKLTHFEMQLSGEKDPKHYPYRGFIDYNDNIIDISTGTNMIRGRLVNTNYEIFSGNICKVRINGEFIKDGIAITEKALCYDLSEIYVWALDEKGKPQKRTVITGSQTEDGRRVIKSGLKDGDTIIIDGVQKVRPGCDIKILPPDPVEPQSDHNGTTSVSGEKSSGKDLAAVKGIKPENAPSDPVKANPPKTENAKPDQPKSAPAPADAAKSNALKPDPSKAAK
ncbi:MAG: efflux RND transporter periplasmic adaptor subunit [Planctomycetia bacterium]|nr:efflux RND transporter periplasmic adaptor subunit [Planctomycetia bacterium]